MREPRIEHFGWCSKGAPTTPSAVVTVAWREDLLGEHAMNLGVAVPTAVSGNDEAVVGVRDLDAQLRHE